MDLGPPARFVTRLAGIAGRGSLLALALGTAGAQVFTVGEKTATADVDTAFKATHVELPATQMTERGRRELVRDLDAEQGFAHRLLPLGAILTLHANGNLDVTGDDYKKLLYKGGSFAAIGDRVAVTALEFKGDRLIVDLNGGPYPPHRFLRHIQIGVGPVMTQPNMNDGQVATGCRVVLVFEGPLPEVSAPEVKALLFPIVDFGVKSGEVAYAQTLPQPVQDAIALHKVLVGMNRRMVLASAGAPESKVREMDEAGKRYEEWIYGHQPQTMKFVRFTGDRVSMVKVAELGKPIKVFDQDQMGGYGERPQEQEVANGDAAGDNTRPKAPPTLKRAGEVLPDETNPQSQNGKVQYPPPKKPASAEDGAGSAVSTTTLPTETPAAPPAPPNR